MSTGDVIQANEWLNRKWKSVRFDNTPNVMVNNRPVFKDKSELKRIYQDFLKSEIANWRTKREERTGETVPKYRVVCAWKPLRIPNRFKFQVTLKRPPKNVGGPEDTKTPTQPNQQPPPIP